jgi:LPXTG-motif cell wall-anchored protein
MSWGFKMFGKLSVSILVISLSCFAQVTTSGGYATNSQSSMLGAVVSSDNPPLVSTPDIALPGSGPAVGAPLSSAAANDSRFSTGPSVHSANAIAPQVAGNNGTVAFGLPANESVQTSATSAGAQSFEFGIQHFESGLPNANTSMPSLGQIARNYRAQHRKAARSFNNDSISQMNAAGVRTGNLGPESSATLASSTQPSAMQPASSGTLIAQNQPPALPQSDQDQSTQASQSVRPSATATQQRHPVEAPSPAAAQSNPVPTQNSTASQNADAKSSAKLPQTASPLPLFFLIGGLGIAGGALYLLRR